jgi:hypothetical protein
LRRWSLAVCVSLFTFSLSAQDRATLIGTITDPSGAIVSGAAVELRSADTGLHRESSTNESGIYEFSSLPIGSYSISVSKAGFKPVVIRQVDLLFGQVRTLDATLDVGSTTESVEVNARIDALNRTNGEIGGVVEAAQIREIPLDGRGRSTPGTARSAASASTDIRSMTAISLSTASTPAASRSRPKRPTRA